MRILAYRPVYFRAALVERRPDVVSAERSLPLSTTRYQAGITTYLEVITAQSAALANQITAANILTRRMTASVLTRA